MYRNQGIPLGSVVNESGYLMLSLQVEEAESGALSLEDTGDFASRLAALSTSRTETSVGGTGIDSEDNDIRGMESQKKNNKDGLSHGETSIDEEKTSVQQGDKGDQVDEQRGEFANSETGEGAAEAGESSDQKDKMQELAEEKVQQVVNAIQDSFLQMLEAGKEDLVEKQGGVEAKKVDKEEEKYVGCSGKIEETT